MPKIFKTLDIQVRCNGLHVGFNLASFNSYNTYMAPIVRTPKRIQLQSNPFGEDKVKLPGSSQYSALRTRSGSSWHFQPSVFGTSEIRSNSVRRRAMATVGFRSLGEGGHSRHTFIWCTRASTTDHGGPVLPRCNPASTPASLRNLFWLSCSWLFF